MDMMERICVDYKETSPSPGTILEDQIMDDQSREVALACARMDLFFLTHAPAIYNDPVKVKAICGDTPVTCLQYSSFLLWSDQTLATLCASELGAAYKEFMTESMKDAMQLVVDHQPEDGADSDAEDASMTSTDEATAASLQDASAETSTDTETASSASQDVNRRA